MSDTNVLSLVKPYPRRPGEVWKLCHFAFRRPYDHPTDIQRSKRGIVLIQERQFWVEKSTQRLVIIAGVVLNPAKAGKPYPHIIMHHPYLGDRVKKVGEQAFRKRFQIWDDYIVAFTVATLKRGWHLQHDADAPWEGLSKPSVRSVNVFGLDEFGFRVAA